MGLAILISAAAVVGSVYLHLGALLFLRTSLRTLRSLTRFILGTVVLFTIVAHLLEMGLFAIGIYILARWDPPTTLEGEEVVGHLDALYYSAVSYTSLGGSPLPTAELRLLTAVEALTGLILITWTASFLFLIMQRFWGSHVD